MDKYICKCGREFTSSQSLYGHQSHCRVSLGEERYQKSLKRDKKAQVLAASTRKFISQDNKERFLEYWLEEEHKCEKCDKIMIEYYGSGRFCSRECSNSHKRTTESKLKTSLSLFKSSVKIENYIPTLIQEYSKGIITSKNLRFYLKDKIYKEDYIICPYCDARISQIQISHLSLHNKTFKDLFSEFGEDYPTVSIKTKMKKNAANKQITQTLIAEGRHKGWQSRNITSYAEKFWKKVLDENNISYQKEFAVSQKSLGLDSSYNYFLDFLLPGNVDLEIDGKQHKYKDRQESDKVRDKALRASGYVVYRIPWVNPKDNEIKAQIADFLVWYNTYLKDNKLNNL